MATPDYLIDIMQEGQLDKVKPYGTGVEVEMSAKFIQFLHDNRIFSNQRHDVCRWKPGAPLRFNKDTEMEPYSAVFRGDNMIPIGSYSYMTLPVVNGVYELEFSIGRYCSIGGGLRIVGNNHAIDTLSTSTIFYDNGPSWCRAEYEDSKITGGPFVTRQAAKGAPSTGHDVWIGGDVTLNQAVKIGNGAIIAANAHVTKNVPDYAIVGGNKAEVIRYRFPEEIRTELSKIMFWKYRMADLVQFNMQDPAAFIREFHDFGQQIKPWNPAKINLWKSWCEVEGA